MILVLDNQVFFTERINHKLEDIEDYHPVVETDLLPNLDSDYSVQNLLPGIISKLSPP